MSATIAGKMGRQTTTDVQDFINFVYNLCHEITEKPGLNLPATSQITIHNTGVQIESTLHTNEECRKRFAASLVLRLAGIITPEISAQFSDKAKMVWRQLGLDMSELPSELAEVTAQLPTSNQIYCYDSYRLELKAA